MSQAKELLTGKWLVFYQPDDFSLTRVWEILMRLQQWRESNARNCIFIQVNLDKTHATNSIRISHNALDVKLADHNLDNIRPEVLNIIAPINHRFSPPALNRVTLLYPAMITDKRWKSIEIPTTWLFLGSALRNANFEVNTRLLPLPSESSASTWNQTDVLAITLYEDTWSEVKDFLNSLRPAYRKLIAAGGPLITLNPWQSAFHLHEINLMVRGEADFVFPDLLQAINSGQPDLMFKHQGFFFHWNGFMVISDFDQINRPSDFNNFHFNLDFLRDDQYSNGLELNTSRGCNRSCLFCSQLQGKQLRKIPSDKLDQLLGHFSSKLKSLKIRNPDSRTVNINDDDLLQDPMHTLSVLKLIKKHRFKLWGIQTSINSFFPSRHTVDIKLIDILSDRSIYVNNTPLLWIGTDTFLKKRGKRLGKNVPDLTHIEELIRILEDQGIQNYHYWISSDLSSNWAEFIEEFLYIIHLKESFTSFNILAHSPFLIPYSTTPIYQRIINDPTHRHQLKSKNILKTGHSHFDFIQISRVETPFPYLNRLLNNEPIVHSSGFFDHLKSGDLFNALRTAHTCLRHERLALESFENPDYISSLKQLEKKTENRIGKLIP